MKVILTTRYVDVPKDVTISVRSRIVRVTGPRGTLTRNFKHLNLDIRKQGNRLRVDLWNGNRKAIACIRTVCSAIENLITGVTKGFLYKMRFVYAHFPINVTCNEGVVEVRNFVGQKLVRRIPLLEGVDYVRTSDVKDQIELSGNDLNNVSLTAAQIQQACTVRNKDIRKFLDGIYVSHKGNVVVEDQN